MRSADDACHPGHLSVQTVFVSWCTFRGLRIRWGSSTVTRNKARCRLLLHTVYKLYCPVPCPWVVSRVDICERVIWGGGVGGLQYLSHAGPPRLDGSAFPYHTTWHQEEATRDARPHGLYITDLFDVTVAFLTVQTVITHYSTVSVRMSEDHLGDLWPS